MRVLILATLVTTLATPVLAQVDPSWQRERNAAIQAEQAARRDALEYQREARAREQRARTEAIVRANRDGELAGGPTALPTYRPSAITTPQPPRAPTPMVISADQQRMDAIMAEALARSNARVKAASGNR